MKNLKTNYALIAGLVSIFIYNHPASSKPTTPKGWNSSGTSGIYWRWCEDCPNTAIGDQGYNVIQIWCKNRDCGDIYVRANLLINDAVVGWTNSTGFGSKGQKVNLTLSSFTEYDQVQLTHMNFR